MDVGGCFIYLVFFFFTSLSLSHTQSRCSPKSVGRFGRPFFTSPVPVSPIPISYLPIIRVSMGRLVPWVIRYRVSEVLFVTFPLSIHPTNGDLLKRVVMVCDTGALGI